jgi:hypothetical protein
VLEPQILGNVCLCPKNFDQGAFAEMRRSAVRMLNMAGSSRGFTSSQSSGTDTGAWGRHRTENGGTIV